jgi:hypothetical protein
VVLLQRHVCRDHIEVLTRDQAGEERHVAHIRHHGWQTHLESGTPLPPGITAIVVFPDGELRVGYHRVEVPGREAEWYSVEGDDRRYDLVLEIVRCYLQRSEKPADDEGDHS